MVAMLSLILTCAADGDREKRLDRSRRHMPDAGIVLGQSLTLPVIKSSFLCGALDVRAHPCVSTLGASYSTLSG